MREEKLGDRLGQVLKDIHIPDSALAQIENSVSDVERNLREEKKQQREKLEHRLTAIRRHIDQAYMDKLDGKITEDFWPRKTTEWQLEEQQIQIAMQGLQDTNTDQSLTVKRTLELANKAYFLYVTQNPSEQAKMLKTVLSNCRVDAASLYPSYRKAFDLIFQRAKSREWRALSDDLRTLAF